MKKILLAILVLALTSVMLVSCSKDSSTEPTNTNTPTITVSPSNLNFGEVMINSNSVEEFTLTGVNLTDNITVTAPTGFKVSKYSSSGFANSISYTVSNGNVNSTVYVKFEPIANQEYSNNISCTSSGASAVSVSIIGMGIGPVIETNFTNLSFGDVIINSTADDDFTLTGSNLSGNITVTAPTGYLVSKTYGSGYTNSISYTPAEVNNSATVYVRFAPTSEQYYSGNISCTTSGASRVDVSVTGTGLPVPISRICFWTDIPDEGYIDIYINNSPVGTLTQHFYAGEPSFGANGTLTVERNPGTYTIKAISQTGVTRTSTVTINAGEQKMYHVTGSGSGSTTGKICFWTNKPDFASPITISLNGSYVGSLSYYFTSTPQFNQDGTLTVEKEAGQYQLYAEDQAGTYWQGTVTFVAGQQGLLCLSGDKGRPLIVQTPGAYPIISIEQIETPKLKQQPILKNNK